MSVLTTGHGYQTVGLIRRPNLIADYEKRFSNYFKAMNIEGIVSAEQGGICAKYLTYTTDYNDLRDCEIIFECVSENLETKHEVYAQIEKSCPKVRAICSVSSAIIPDQLASSATKYKDRIIVTHPFKPAHIVPYFELCGGKDTDPAVITFAKEFLESLDRKPTVLKKPSPGFIGNRLQFALWREALNLVESGICDPEDVDTCLRYSFMPRYTAIGMFEHFDNGDLRLNITTCNTVFPTLSNVTEAPAVLTDKVENDDTGVRAESMTGFYDWKAVDLVAFRKRALSQSWKFVNWEFPTE
jgi:3-hydroxybutyryl-CoA dehydrogenase